MKKTIYLFSLVGALITLLTLSCNTPSQFQYFVMNTAAATDTAETPTSRKKHIIKHRACRDQSSYIPDTNYIDHYTKRFVRINFHWVLKKNEPNLFTEEEAVAYSKGLLYAANYDLNKNRKMWLPHNNDTPVLPILFEYVLTPTTYIPDDDGIYFHYDDALSKYVDRGKNRNIFDRTVIDSFGVQLDTVINIFLMQHHPDSIKSPTYPNYSTGVALRNAVKLGGLSAKDSYWDRRSSVNHEVGHLYGLSHTWAYNDGCDDTPKNPKECFSKTDEPKCDTLTSNNIMDYVALRNSWSPCQIGRVHKKMSMISYTRKRNLLEPTWCELQEDKHIYITDKIDWECHKDIEGNITIERGGELQLFCRLSLPKGAVITVKAGGKLILNGCHLHNACGDEWKGIRIEEKGDKKGKVEIVGDVLIEDTPQNKEADKA